MANFKGYLKDKDNNKIYPESNFPSGTVLFEGRSINVTADFASYKYLLIYVSWYNNTPDTTFIAFENGKEFSASATVYSNDNVFWYTTGTFRMTNTSLAVTHGYQMNLLDGAGGFYDCCNITKVIGFK